MINFCRMRPITTHQDASCRMLCRIRYTFTTFLLHRPPLGSGMPLPLWQLMNVERDMRDRALVSKSRKLGLTRSNSLISWLSCGLEIGTSLASMTGVVRSQGKQWPCNCWQPSEIQILRLGHGVEKHTWIKRSCQHTQCKLQTFSCAKFDVLIFQVSSVPLRTWIGKYQMNESATSLPQPSKNESVTVDNEPLPLMWTINNRLQRL